MSQWLLLHGLLLLLLLCTVCDATISRRDRSLFSACKRGPIKRMARLLKQKSLDPAFTSNSSLIEAAALGKAGLVERLLLHPQADPSAKSSLALRKACKRGYSRTVGVLLKDGRADPNVSHQIVFRHAIIKGQYKILQLLLEDGRIEPRGPLRRLIKSDDLQSNDKIFRLLMEDGRVDLSLEANACLFEAFADEDAGATEVLLQSPKVRRLFILTLANCLLEQGKLGSTLANQHHFVRHISGAAASTDDDADLHDEDGRLKWNEALEAFRPQLVYGTRRHVSVWGALRRVDPVFARLYFAEKEIIAGRMDEYGTRKQEEYFIKQALRLKKRGCGALAKLVLERLAFMTLMTFLWAADTALIMQDILPLIESQLYLEFQ